MSEKYFPELTTNEVTSNDNKWGILNLYLGKCKNVVTGYQWKYTYFDGEKLKVISSYDLIRLREKVEAKGLPWCITDNKAAIDSYILNRDLLKKYNEIKNNNSKKNTTSGVKYVYKSLEKSSKNGYYWSYRDQKNKNTIQATRLSLLKERIEAEGLPWIIINEEKYNEWIAEGA